MTERHNIITEKHDLMTVSDSDSLAIVGKTNKDNIDNFFSKNYELLLKISKDYCRTYKYTRMQVDELISELYLHIIFSADRQKKISELIKISAATVNYIYDNKAMYYLIDIIWKRSKMNMGFHLKKQIKLLYVNDYNIIKNHNDDDSDDSLNIQHIFELSEIEEIIEHISHIDNNYWKAELWRMHYIYKLTYKEMSEKTRIKISPLFTAIHNFNNQVIKELLKNHCNLQ